MKLSRVSGTGSLTQVRQSKPQPTVNLSTGIYLRTSEIRAFTLLAYLIHTLARSLSPSTAFTRSQIPFPTGSGITSQGHWLAPSIHLPHLRDLPHIPHLSSSGIFTFFLAPLPPSETTSFWEPFFEQPPLFPVPQVLCFPSLHNLHSDQ